MIFDAEGSPEVPAIKRAKADLRREMRGLREALDRETVVRAGAAIALRLEAVPAYSRAECVLFYLDQRNEVPTGDMIHRALAAGKRAFVPVMTPGTRELRLSELPRDGRFRCEPGRFGIPEPAPEFRRWADPDLLECVVVPGLAYDVRGNRLGFGQGYYDRFLAGLGSGVLKLAPAYGFQVVALVPVTDSDVPVDAVVTEEKIFHRALPLEGDGFST